MKHTPTKPQIEVVGIYPEKYKKGIIATFHIYLIDKDIDIRGGVIFKKPKGDYFVQVPQASGTCEETGKKIFFPVISFTDKEYEKSLRKLIIGEVLKKLKTMKLTSIHKNIPRHKEIISWPDFSRSFDKLPIAKIPLGND